MNDTSGFYKHDNGTMLYGPNYVINAGYELLRDLHETYVYPRDGWEWFDSAENAYASHGLMMPESDITRIDPDGDQR